MSSVERVVSFVEFVLKGVVESPEYVRVVVDVQPLEEGVGDEDVFKKAILYIYAIDADCGRIIGKQGQMIRAIRTLITSIAGKDGYRWSVSVVKSSEKEGTQIGGISGSSAVSV